MQGFSLPPTHYFWREKTLGIYASKKKKIKYIERNGTKVTVNRKGK